MTMDRLLTEEEMLKATQEVYGHIEIDQRDIDKGVKAIAKAQDAKTLRIILETITEDFVEPVANFYMNDRDRKRTFELWNSVEKQLGR